MTFEENWNHGTLSCYSNSKCRCYQCKEANSIYQKDYRKRRAASIDTIKHGTSSGYYTCRCRCDKCVKCFQEIRLRRIEEGNINPKIIKHGCDGYKTYKCRCDICKKANQEYHRSYYSTRRQLIHEAKNTPCMDCNTSYPLIVMDFDHRDPSKKKFSMAKARSSNFTLDEIKTEIDKCDVVCSNCHRIRTAIRAGWSDLVDTGLDQSDS